MIFYSCTNKKLVSEYRGGGVEVWTKLRLYDDSTYVWTYADHTDKYYKDKGQYLRIGEKYYLNSTSGNKRKRNKHFKTAYFGMNEFMYKTDSLYIFLNETKGFNYKASYLTDYAKYK